MPIRTFGGGVAAGASNWQTLFDEDLTGYATTDLLASGTITSDDGDLWDLADARTSATNMTSFGFVNGSGLRFQSTGAAREAFHQRNLSAAATAVSWTLADTDDVCFAFQVDSEFTGGTQALFFLALRKTARTQGFTVNRRWATSASRIMYAHDGTTTDQSSTVARTAGLVTAVVCRAGSFTMYTGSTWPTGGDVSGMTVEGHYGEQDGDPDPCVLPATDTALEIELAYYADTAQDVYVERWGAWVRH